MKNKYILDFASLNEIVHGDLKTITLVFLGNSDVLSDKLFSKNIKQSLKRTTHHIKELSPKPNKKEYRLMIDANQYQIITDFLNDITRELKSTLEKLKVKNINIEYRDDTILVKL
jgi:hypothetical protein